MKTIMDNELKHLKEDADGLLTYEYIANHIEGCREQMPELVSNMIEVDKSGQFLVSAARYLCAIDRTTYHDEIYRLVSAAIDRDRERKYIADLLPSVWGADYANRVGELSASDDNFRRIYKRVYVKNGI
ncbi:MAG: hypothetical protein HDS15_05785 [Bacteroides sp.]|nr:hypothetical protein [Bacteroides sp.]MDE7471098.1 hypothetical protein [Paramuribaculum sp.]